jgi:hypothetical protein
MVSEPGSGLIVERRKKFILKISVSFDTDPDPAF